VQRMNGAGCNAANLPPANPRMSPSSQKQEDQDESARRGSEARVALQDETKYQDCFGH